MLKRKGKIAKEIYLTPYGLRAERHWRVFRRKMVRDLEAKGALMEALFEAQKTTLAEMEAYHPAARSGAENDVAAGARPGLGDDSREIYSAPATVCVLADKIRLSFGESISVFGIPQKTNMPMAAQNMSKVAIATQVTASDELG